MNAITPKVVSYINEGSIIGANTAGKALNAILPKATRHPYLSPYAIIKTVIPRSVISESIESYVVSHGIPLDKTIAIV